MLPLLSPWERRARVKTRGGAKQEQLCDHVHKYMRGGAWSHRMCKHIHLEEGNETNLSRNNGSYNIFVRDENAFRKKLASLEHKITVTLGYSTKKKHLLCTVAHISSTCAAVKHCCITRQPVSKEFFWRVCPWWQTFDAFWLDSGGGDYQRLREINVLLIKKTWVGGRQTFRFMTGPVSALSPASQIP